MKIRSLGKGKRLVKGKRWYFNIKDRKTGFTDWGFKHHFVIADSKWRALNKAKGLIKKQYTSGVYVEENTLQPDRPLWDRRDYR